MSNLDDFNKAAGSSETTYGRIAHHCNTTVEDCMCAINYWKTELVSRWAGLYPHVDRWEKEQDLRDQVANGSC